MGNVARILPKIFAVVDNFEEEHQVAIIEMEGDMCNKIIYILIYPIYKCSYIDVELVEKCKMARELYKGSWLVQLQIGTERKNSYSVKSSAFDLIDMPTITHLNLFAFVSYNILLGMH